MAAPAFIDLVSNVNTGGTSVTLDFDSLASVNAGENLVVFVGVDNDDAAGVNASGFTNLVEQFGSSGSQSCFGAVLWKEAVGDESGNLTVNLGSSANDGISATMVRYGAGDGVTPLASGDNDGRVSGPAAPGSVLAAGEWRVVSCVVQDVNANSYSASPAGMANRMNAGSNSTGITIAVSDLAVTGDGSTTHGDDAWTMSTARNANAFSIAFKEGATAPAEEAEGAYQAGGSASAEDSKGVTGQATGQGAGSSAAQSIKGATTQATHNAGANYSATALSIKNAVTEAVYRGAESASAQASKNAVARSSFEAGETASVESSKSTGGQAAGQGGFSSSTLTRRHAFTRASYSMGGVASGQIKKGSIANVAGQAANISDARHSGAHTTQAHYTGGSIDTASQTTAKGTEAAHQGGGNYNSTHSAGAITAVNAAHQAGGSASAQGIKGAAAMAAFHGGSTPDSRTRKGAIAVLRFEAGANYAATDSPGFTTTVNGSHQGAGFGTVQHTTKRFINAAYQGGATAIIEDFKGSIAIITHNGEFISTSIHIKAVDARAHYEIGALYQALTQPIIIPSKIILSIDHLHKIGLSIEHINKIGLSIEHINKVTLTINRE